MTGTIESDYDTGWREGYEAASGIAQIQIDRLRDLLDEVRSCGHWSDCPAGFNAKYRCRCAYGIIAEGLDH